MDKQLRIIAGAIVTGSRLNKETKLQFLNFIQKEATETQIKALLLDGKVITNIDEQTEQIINDRFSQKNIFIEKDKYLKTAFTRYLKK